MTYTPTFDTADMYQNGYWYVCGNTCVMMVT